MKNYEFVFTQFQDEFADRLADSITPDEILSFLTKLTDGTKQTTKRNRYRRKHLAVIFRDQREI